MNEASKIEIRKDNKFIKQVGPSILIMGIISWNIGYTYNPTVNLDDTKLDYFFITVNTPIWLRWTH